MSDSFDAASANGRSPEDRPVLAGNPSTSLATLPGKPYGDPHGAAKKRMRQNDVEYKMSVESNSASQAMVFHVEDMVERG